MIKINGQDFPGEQGMTVRQVILEKKYTYPALMVSVNGLSVSEEEYDTRQVFDGDSVLIIHPIAGG